MRQEKSQASRDITLHWRNFIIVILVILVVGILIGLIITPHPDSQKKATPEEVFKQASYSGLSFFLTPPIPHVKHSGSHPHRLSGMAHICSAMKHKIS